VRKIGYHGEDAIHTIDRLIIADLDLSKATGLAKVAKDAAAIEDIAAPEALEKILQAIEFGNARALRSAGLVVNFEREITTRELLLGRTLSDNEKCRLATTPSEGGRRDPGRHAGALGEAELQMKAFSREAHELREAVGVQFQDQFKAVLALLPRSGGLSEGQRELAREVRGGCSVCVCCSGHGRARVQDPGHHGRCPGTDGRAGRQPVGVDADWDCCGRRHCLQDLEGTRRRGFRSVGTRRSAVLSGRTSSAAGSAWTPSANRA